MKYGSTESAVAISEKKIKSRDEGHAAQSNAFAIDALQHKWQMAGSEDSSLHSADKIQSEGLARCEMTAIERFGSRLQQK